MPDVREMKEWHERIVQVKDFAVSIGAEYEMRVLPDGKEYVMCRLFYRPRKEERNGVISQKT